MSTIGRQITTQTSGIPKISVGILITILLLGIFVVGYDQGHLFSTVQGKKGIRHNVASQVLS